MTFELVVPNNRPIWGSTKSAIFFFIDLLEKYTFMQRLGILRVPL